MDDLEAMKLELRELNELGVLRVRLERCTSYIDNNQDECREYCQSMGITCAVDLVTQLV